MGPVKKPYRSMNRCDLTGYSMGKSTAKGYRVGGLVTP